MRKKYRVVLGFLVASFFGVVTAAYAENISKPIEMYKVVDLSKYKPRVASSVMDLVAPLYKDHPEALEGNPQLKINLEKNQLNQIVLKIEMEGYLDDALAGELYHAVIVRTKNGNAWELKQLSKQWKCYRSPVKRWTATEICP